MALNIDLHVNDTPIGYIGIQRTSGSIGRECKYKYVIKMQPHPLTREQVVVDGDGIEHHYNDSSLALLQKVLEEALGDA